MIIYFTFHEYEISPNEGDGVWPLNCIGYYTYHMFGIKPPFWFLTFQYGAQIV